MTNQEIINSYENLASLSRNNAMCFPAQVAYAITRNLRILQSFYEDIINQRRLILNANAEPLDDEPGFFRPKKGCEEVLNRELTALGKYDNEITISKITLDDLSGLNLSITDMDALYFMVDG